MKKEVENMEFTGERYVPEAHGNIELEHLHRYLQACEIAAGKVVLDIASGEGYGSAMLANRADKVIGVDISVEAVEHARKRYNKENLEYRVGTCADIPVPDASVDLVVSFETIEHHDQHETMMQEIKRVLRPTGVLLMSTPDKYHYSVERGYSNQYHVKELDQRELKQLLGNYFKNVTYFGQRVIYGSGIFAESLATPSLSYWQENEVVREAPGIVKPIYRIALASNVELPRLAAGVLEQPINDSEIIQSWGRVVAERDGQIASLNQGVAERDGQIVSLNQAVTERDGQIASLNQALLAEKETSLQTLQGQLEAAQSRIVSLEKNLLEMHNQLETKQALLAEKETFLQTLQSQLEAAQSRIVSLEKNLLEMQAQARERAQQWRAEKIAMQAETAALRSQVEEVLDSASWRITKSYRELRTGIERISSNLGVFPRKIRAAWYNAGYSRTSLQEFEPQTVKVYMDRIEDTFRWLSGTEIDGETKAALFLHPPAEVVYQFKVPPRARFRAFVALQREAWGKNPNGVVFRVQASSVHGGESIRWTHHVHPGGFLHHRAWNECNLSLGQFADQEVTLTLSTNPPYKGTIQYAWAVWGDPAILSRKKQQAFSTVLRGLFGGGKSRTTGAFELASQSSGRCRGLSPVSQRDLSLDLQQEPVAGMHPAAGRLDHVTLSALELKDEPQHSTADPVLHTIYGNPEIPEMIKVYFTRIFDASRDDCYNKHLFPQCAIQVDVQRLKQDFLAQMFLYHLCSFRKLRVNWDVKELAETIPLSSRPTLLIQDVQYGTFTVTGDGKQNLMFALLDQSLTVEKNIGLVCRHPSLDFLERRKPQHEFISQKIPLSLSVVIPVYDRTTDLLQAIGSVLNQDYPWVELVLVFNGSPCETLRLLPHLRTLIAVRRYRQKIILMPFAYGNANIPRNVGCYAATGDFIVFLDSDDCLESPDFITQAADKAQHVDRHCCILYPETVVFHNIGRSHTIQGTHIAKRPPVCNWDVLWERGNVLNNSGVCIRRDAFVRVGGMNPAMDYCEDYELFMRLLRDADYGLPFSARVQIRLHPNNNEIKFEARRAHWVAMARHSAQTFGSQSEVRNA